MRHVFRITTSLAVLTLASAVVSAQDIRPRDEDLREPQKIYSPYVARTVADANLAEGVYWGDTHLHTSYSTDSGMLGNTLGPEEAYRFARGEEVLSAAGMRARLIRRPATAAERSRSGSWMLLPKAKIRSTIRRWHARSGNARLPSPRNTTSR